MISPSWGVTLRAKKQQNNIYLSERAEKSAPSPVFMAATPLRFVVLLQTGAACAIIRNCRNSVAFRVCCSIGEGPASHAHRTVNF
jgi:hypothetical protein